MGREEKERQIERDRNEACKRVEAVRRTGWFSESDIPFSPHAGYSLAEHIPNLL